MAERRSAAAGTPSIGSFYGAVRLSSKGQIVIPRRVREEFGLATGDQLIVLGRPDQDGFALLKPEGFLRVQQELSRLQAQLGGLAAGGSASSAGEPASPEAETDRRSGGPKSKGRRHGRKGS
ncbi:MAG TPA: AbrB/MazE/SpoVT family DNA-binding domain-containing protein [Candidatus Limnocylindrales bacterium]